MRIIKTLGRRGRNDVMWCVGGTVRVLTIEEAADLAFEVHALQVKAAPVHTLWTAYPVAA